MNDYYILIGLNRKEVRKYKRIVKELYDLIKSTIDFNIEIVDSISLKELELISKLDEELTDIIYMIKDIKKPLKNRFNNLKGQKFLFFPYSTYERLNFTSHQKFENQDFNKCNIFRQAKKYFVLHNSLFIYCK